METSIGRSDETLLMKDESGDSTCLPCIARHQGAEDGL